MVSGEKGSYRNNAWRGFKDVKVFGEFQPDKERNPFGLRESVFGRGGRLGQKKKREQVQGRKLGKRSKYCLSARRGGGVC